MKASIMFTLAFGCLLAMPALQAQQAAAPAGSTGQCKDGTYSNSASKHGACKGHKGVKEWYTAASDKSAKTAAAPAAAAAAAAPAAASKTAMSSHTAAASGAAASGAAASGGGPGMVWVNEGSKVYHCPGDKWYGKTKHGEYMSEADAKAKGNHPDHGKACKP